MCAHCAWSLRNYSSTATLLICVAGFSELAVFQSPRSKRLGLPAEEFRFPIPTQVRNSKCRPAFSTLLMAHGTNMPNAKVINVLLMRPFPSQDMTVSRTYALQYVAFEFRNSLCNGRQPVGYSFTL